MIRTLQQTSKNVMRMEKKFGRAKKEDSQTMQQWISYVKTLDAQLCEAEVEITSIRIVHRILSGLPKEYDSLKYSLKTRPGLLSIEVITEHLLEAETGYEPSAHGAQARFPDRALGQKEVY